MPSVDITFAQDEFLHKGGLFLEAMKTKAKIKEQRRRAGLPDDDGYQEYPKVVRLNQREVELDRSTEDVRGKTINWKEKKTVYDEITVSSAEEEDRVLSGGKPTKDMEEERLGLIRRCQTAGLRVDLSWSAVRLRKELGEKLDEPEPVDREGALEAELAQLRRIASMQAEIAALKAQVNQPAATDEADGLRAELTALGVAVDKRWGLPRLREELEAATAPGSKVAA